LAKTVSAKKSAIDVPNNGKTSLIDIIYLSIYGDTLRKNLYNHVEKGVKDCMQTEINISVNNVHFEICRTVTYFNNSVLISRCDQSGEITSLSFPDINTANNYIETEVCPKNVFEIGTCVLKRNTYSPVDCRTKVKLAVDKLSQTSIFIRTIDEIESRLAQTIKIRNRMFADELDDESDEELERLAKLEQLIADYILLKNMILEISDPQSEHGVLSILQKTVENITTECSILSTKMPTKMSIKLQRIGNNVRVLNNGVELKGIRNIRTFEMILLLAIAELGSETDFKFCLIDDVFDAVYTIDIIDFMIRMCKNFDQVVVATHGPQIYNDYMFPSRKPSYQQFGKSADYIHMKVKK
jgi:hypothetical protein